MHDAHSVANSYYSYGHNIHCVGSHPFLPLQVFLSKLELCGGEDVLYIK